MPTNHKLKTADVRRGKREPRGRVFRDGQLLTVRLSKLRAGDVVLVCGERRNWTEAMEAGEIVELIPYTATPKGKSL